VGNPDGLVRRMAKTILGSGEGEGVKASLRRREFTIPAHGVTLPGTLVVPSAAQGVVAFVHGTGSSRFSPRNAAVAARLNAAGLATFLFDLLTADEAFDRTNVFDVPLLAERLNAATRELSGTPELRGSPLGLFGASTGAAAALWAAAGDAAIAAVVSRGGRPDLALPRLAEVRAPTLLIVGSQDPVVLELNRTALGALRCRAELRVVDGATHLFEEPGTLEEVADLASDWFLEHLTGGRNGA
jgi:putative phosphoribosyl transferase